MAGFNHLSESPSQASLVGLWLADMQGMVQIAGVYAVMISMPWNSAHVTGSARRTRNDDRSDWASVFDQPHLHQQALIEDRAAQGYGIVFAGSSIASL